MPTESNGLLTKVMDLLLDAVCVVDREGRFVWVGGACETIFGFTADEMVGQTMIELVFPEDREVTLQVAAEVIAGTPRQHFRNRYVRKDGSIMHIMWSARSSADGMRVAVARDINRLVRAEGLQAAVYAISEAAHAAEDLPALLRRVHQVIAALLPASSFYAALSSDKDDGLTLVYSVGECGDGPGLSPLEAESRLQEIVRAEQARMLSSAEAQRPDAAASVEQQGIPCLGIPLRSRTGVLGALLLVGDAGERPYSHQDRELLQFVGDQIATAIERKQAALELRHMAMYDPLTDLPNRALLNDRLTVARTRARRSRVRLALLFIDLDGFKEVNDGFGHEVGDLVLREVAQRLRLAVRESDTVARLGGDEFVVILDAVGTAEHALLVADRIRAALARTFTQTEPSIAISSSIGVALYPDHGSDNQQLLRGADQAMYEAKANGKNCVRMCAVVSP